MRNIIIPTALAAALTALPAHGERKESVLPLLTSEWGQNAPYNNLCPEYAPGRRCKTSCVATAMTQIMRYHKYPAQGRGEKSMKWSYGSQSATLTADFGATTYLWNEMLDNYRGQYTQAQADAVATVMYHFGIASDAEYTPDSGAYIDDAFMAAINYFRYSTQSVLADREYFDDATWTELVFDAISAGFPVYYGGYTASYAGHAFIIDGYNARGEAHVNWGDGTGGGYYPMSRLGSYVYGQSAMLFYPTARPDDMQSWMVCSTGVSVSDAQVPRNDEKASLTVNADIKNFTAEAPTVTFGLMLRDDKGATCYAEGELLTLPDNKYVSLKSFNVPVSAFPTSGRFEATPFYRTSDSQEWTPVKMLSEDATSTFHVAVSPKSIKADMSGIDNIASESDHTMPFITSHDTIRLISPSVTEATIYDTRGMLIAGLTQSSPLSPILPQGIYIVTTPTRSYKVRI